jgi:hypothetical protein
MRKNWSPQDARARARGETIEEWQKNGWRLHTYTCAQAGMGEIINHYLLFEREVAS